jgi:hypothetical protein
MNSSKIATVLTESTPQGQLTLHDYRRIAEHYLPNMLAADTLYRMGTGQRPMSKLAELAINAYKQTKLFPETIIEDLVTAAHRNLAAELMRSAKISEESIKQNGMAFQIGLAIAGDNIPNEQK